MGPLITAAGAYPEPNDGTLSPDNPTAAEGRADEDMGEAAERVGGDL